MNKMKTLENKFYEMHPEGFNSEEMKQIEKKHKLDKLQGNTREVFSKEGFNRDDFLENYRKIINQSTLVSRFEKPAFKDFMNIISEEERGLLKKGLYEQVHGDESLGFQILVDLMTPYKVAKWPILTIVRAYYNLHDDIFIKPTTVKKILKYFEADFKYTSKPNYEFYNQYRRFLLDLKSQASQGVKPNNPAFSGFLMMTIDD